LDHVDEGARLVVVARAVLQGEGLVIADQDLLDVIGRPHRLHEPVREPHAHDVEDRGPAQEVVDAEDLVLRDDAGDEGVQRRRALLVVPERLLQREHRPGGERDVEELLAGGDRHGGRQREVDHERAIGVPDERRERVVVRDVCLRVGRAGDPGDLVVGADRGEGGAHGLLPAFVGPVVGPRSAQHEPAVGLALQQLGDRGQEEPGREVSGCAEDEQRRRGGHAPTIRSVSRACRPARPDPASRKIGLGLAGRARGIRRAPGGRLRS